MVIQLTIGNNHTGTFIFDTGAASTVINEKVAKQLGIEPESYQEINGASGVERYGILAGQTLHTTAGHPIKKVVFVLTDLSNLEKGFGYALDGIIGYDILKNYVTHIDFNQNTLNLYHKVNEVPMNGYTKIPFKTMSNIPLIEVSMQLKNGEVLQGTAIFDSGAGLTLMVNTPFSQANNLSQKTGRSFKYSKPTGLTNHMSSFEVFGIQSLSMHGFTFTDLPVTLTNATSGVASYEGYLGLLGSDIIYRFNMVLDYRKQHIYLKPNNQYGNVFEKPMSGFGLEQENDQLLVRYVDQSSPAWQKGIRPGHTLLSINGQPANDLIKARQLLKAEGQTVQLTLKAPEGGQLEVSLKLESLI